MRPPLRFLVASALLACAGAHAGDRAAGADSSATAADAAEAVPAAAQGMVVHRDPQTGQLRAGPMPGTTVDFPELRVDASRVVEEVLADGTVLTHLNGAGVEAQVLATDADGGRRVICSSASEAAAGRAGDLRGAVAAREVRHAR